jgi:hypothetical protein
LSPPLPPAASKVILLAPNVIALGHWERLERGALLACSPRVDWASLLRRTFETEVLECPRCGGRLRPIALITDADVARCILAAMGVPVEAPPVARARDPTWHPDVSYRDEGR